MSYDGEQYLVVATLPPGANAGASVRALTGWMKQGVAVMLGEADDDERPIVEPDGGIRLAYVFGFGETHPVRLAELAAIVELGWSLTADDDVTTVATLEPAAVAGALAACKAAAKDPGALAVMICEQLETPGAVGEVTALLGDREALTDARRGDADALRLAQMLAAIARGLVRAAKRKHGLLVVYRELPF